MHARGIRQLRQPPWSNPCLPPWQTQLSYPPNATPPYIHAPEPSQLSLAQARLRTQWVVCMHLHLSIPLPFCRTSVEGAAAAGGISRRGLEWQAAGLTLGSPLHSAVSDRPYVQHPGLPPSCQGTTTQLPRDHHQLWAYLLGRGRLLLLELP